ncbi:hypothetical protein ACUXST_001339 [Sphingomonas sp. F9_3S_D5_B_2]
MRGIWLLVAAAAAASCSTAPEPTTRSPQGQRQFEQLIAGKVAGPPVSCLPSYQSNDMVVIDERTIAYRLGSGRVYINNMRGACNNLGNGTALVTRSFGSPQTCSGDIAQVADLTNRMTVGSCVFGQFVPYSKPR